MTTEIEQTITPSTRVAATSQGTAIEQQRAIAEVQAMVIVAQQVPRSIDAAIRQMRESCAQPALAERAFYKYPRGGQQITGPSVHLARELARCFGNVTYGITELRRDDEAGESEMQAFAWDLEKNARSAQIFIVPHKRDKQGGPVDLTDMREIYEQTANQGARRLREAIFAILPPWYVEEAKERCTATLAGDAKKPREQRIVDAVEAFESTHNVTVDQLEAKLGRAKDRWTDHDLAELTVTFKSLGRNEVLLDEVFPPQRVTAAEITGSPQGGSPAPDGDGPQESAPDEGPSAAGPSPHPEPAAEDTSSTDESTDEEVPHAVEENASDGDATGEGDDSSSPDSPPETWQEHADRLGVKTVQLLNELRGRWPKNQGWDMPTNRKKIEAAYQGSAENAQRIHEAIDAAGGEGS